MTENTLYVLLYRHVVTQPEQDVGDFYFQEGDVYWLNNVGEIHRDDGPAIEYADGIKMWLKHGKHHREDGPAMEYADGANAWYFNGERHRTDGPACEWSTGAKEWWEHGKRIR